MDVDAADGELRIRKSDPKVDMEEDQVSHKRARHLSHPPRP